LHGVKKDCDFKILPKLSKMVEKFSGQTIAANTPIVGENAFSHKAGLHTRAVLNDPSSYEAINPAILGMERTIVVDQFAGKDALKNRLEKIGLNLDEKELDRVLTDLKNSPKKWISDADLIEFSQNDFKQQEFSTIHHSSINAFVSITLDEKVFVPSISKKIIALPNVKKVYEVTGSQDIFALMEASDVINLNDFIDKISSIEGVSKTSSKIILREHHATNTN
ncbi:MAG: Lrp/AsnC ligand binding domain-containing protein, partial [Candidatus Diapherotrites archaeon]|nr:Lrp/AsnC ligand binding domain-containing protein [Candidatus Diapherotrites archaeon]